MSIYKLSIIQVNIKKSIMMELNLPSNRWLFLGITITRTLQVHCHSIWTDVANSTLAA